MTNFIHSSPRPALWEMLLIWSTVGAVLGTLGGWVFGHIRLGVLIGLVIAITFGAATELIQRLSKTA